jgi:hypothetical protein
MAAPVTTTPTRRRTTPNNPGPSGLGVFRLASKRFVCSMEATCR